MQRAKSFLMLPDYLHFCLTGVKKQEYTNATTTGMVNAISHTWDKEIIEKLGFNCDLFCSLTQPGNMVGAFKGNRKASWLYGRGCFTRYARYCKRCFICSAIRQNTIYFKRNLVATWGRKQPC